MSGLKPFKVVLIWQLHVGLCFSVKWWCTHIQVYKRVWLQNVILVLRILRRSGGFIWTRVGECKYSDTLGDLWVKGHVLRESDPFRVWARLKCYIYSHYYTNIKIKLARLLSQKVSRIKCRAKSNVNLPQYRCEYLNEQNLERIFASLIKMCVYFLLKDVIKNISKYLGILIVFY